MEKLEKKEGVIYTQNIEGLPIEERVFFSHGMVARASDYRAATEEEMKEWEEYKNRMNKGV